MRDHRVQDMAILSEAVAMNSDKEKSQSDRDTYFLPKCLQAREASSTSRVSKRPVTDDDRKRNTAPGLQLTKQIS